MKIRQCGLVRGKALMLLFMLILSGISCEEPERIFKLKTIDPSDVDISYTSATLKGEIIDLGSKKLDEYGIVISKNSMFLTSEPKRASTKAEKGPFIIEFTNLEKQTTYYFKAYAVIGGVPVYTPDNLNHSFTTKATQAATVTAGTITGTTMNSASLNGEVTSDGGETVTKRGLCWGTSANPTLAACLDTTVNGSGTGAFTGMINPLSPATQYYVRAYAINAKGTSYSPADISFSTHNYPTVTSSAVINITNTGATSGGNVTNDGGVAVTARGLVWGTSANPAVTLPTKTSEGSGAGSFVSNITGLTPGTSYFVRAYATNIYGTSYGSDQPFTATRPADAVTSAADLVGNTTATLKGSVNANGFAANVTFEYGTTTAYGFSANATPSPVSGTSAVNVSADISGLVPGTDYHFMVKAVNAGGTSTGADATFRTTAAPIPVTGSANTITNTTAVVTGSVNPNGSSTTVSFEYGTTTAYGLTAAGSPSPLTGSASTAVTGSVTGLTEGTLYHYRVKTVNTSGTAYGSDATFTTTRPPDAATAAASAVTSASAILNGSVNAYGLSTSVSFEYGVTTAYGNEIPALQSPVTGSTSSNVSASLTGLAAGTVYHFRTRASSSAGTSLGSDLTFTTGSSVPTVTTASVSGLTGTTAVSGGNVTSAGGASVIARGVCWSTNMNPSITDPKTSDNSGTGTFSSNITGLIPGTSYHVRAYATNSAGTGYGADVSFTTLDIPTVTTTSVSTITTTSAMSGGNVTSAGGSSVIARGVCWSTNTNPSITDPKTSDNSGTGTFSSNITGLITGTSYHVRAYATNSAGTAYGSDISFTTLGIPTVTTTSASTITSTSAVSGGNVSSTGGLTVTMKGICWSTLPNPTITDPQTMNGPGSGTFNGNMTGLSPNTIYYIRSYAINSAGTGYGNQVTFTTTPLVNDYDGNAYNTVSIGTQLWMMENLKTTHYRDGTPISDAPSSTWSTMVSGAYCWISNNILNKDIYGAMYNGFAVVDNHYLCPTGWHVPTDAEWTAMETYLGGSSIAGGKLKEQGTTHWNSPNTGATNESGFTGLPGGYVTGGTHYTPGSLGHWWSSTWTNQTGTSWARRLDYDYISIFRSANNGNWGHSVRCIQGEGPVLPSVSTSSVTDIKATSAIAGGNIISDGDASILARGVCWSSNPHPLVAGNHSTDGASTGSFSSSVTGLIVGTTYYLRAYATNSVGTAYGEEISFQAVYAVGDTYQGGIIFNITGTYPNQHGLICAQADQSAGAAWGCKGTEIAGADGTELGTGNQNTVDIVNGCPSAGTAAKICSDLNLNGYTDWYLPSAGELALLAAKYRATLSSAFGSANSYWSSSENSITQATFYDFITESSSGTSKDQSLHVRAVRTF